MKTFLYAVAIVCSLGGLAYAWAAPEQKEGAGSQLLSHSVYFALQDSTPENRQQLVDSCKKHLSQHPGIVFFSAGTLCDEIKGGFNDRNFDVVLLMVFKNHDALHDYAKSASHQTFLAENAARLKGVRIFDADVDRVAVPDDKPAQ